MNILHLSFIMLTAIIFLGFGLQPAHADDAYGISIQNIQVQPSTIKVGDKFSITATLVNNSTIPIIVEGGKCSIKDTHAQFFTIMFDNHTKIIPKNMMTCAGVGWSQILDPGKKITGTSPDYTLDYAAMASGTANATVTFSYRITNQTDLTQPGIEKTMSKSLLFTIYDNDTIEKSLKLGNHPVTNKILSPLKQFKGGVISILDIKCMHGFDRLVKTSDGSPACVKPLFEKILIERGWATRTIKVQNTDFEINYAIMGGKLTGATEDLYPQELILSLQTSSDGYLTVNIPKGLINLRNIDYWTDGTIHVSTNHKEINFKQYKSLGYVVITIALKSGMTQVEISSGIPGAVEEWK